LLLAAGEGCTTIPGEIGNLVFYPGVYCSDNVFTIAAGTSVTLDGTVTSQANSGMFFFQAPLAMTTGANTWFNLINGATARDVFFDLGTAATTGAKSVFKGSIRTQNAITLGAASFVIGNVVHGGALTIGAGASIVDP
jgi:hypothetical protein